MREMNIEHPSAQCTGTGGIRQSIGFSFAIFTCASNAQSKLLCAGSRSTAMGKPTRPYRRLRARLSRLSASLAIPTTAEQAGNQPVYFMHGSAGSECALLLPCGRVRTRDDLAEDRDAVTERGRSMGDCARVEPPNLHALAVVGARSRPGTDGTHCRAC